MYRNAAYLGQAHEDIVDTSKPLIITAAGHRKVNVSRIVTTIRPDGRNDYQLIYIASGKVTFYFNKQKQVLGKGNMILYRPGQPQHYLLHATHQPEMYWVHFTGSDVEQILDYYDLSKNQTVFFAGVKPDYQWRYNQLIKELQLRRANFDDALSFNLQHIFLTMNRYIYEKDKIGTQMLAIIEQATHYFYDNYNKDIVIEDYAKEHNLTSHWFTQSFKKITKQTPMQYIISLRLTSAMNMLDNTDYNMARIAAEVGYDNSLYFSRIFKKHIGMSPSEYRKLSAENK